MTIFLILTGAGFVFLLASLLLGDLFDHLGLGVLSSDAGTDSVGLLDSRVISIFLTAFGAFGAIGMSVGFGVAVSSLLGLAGGIVLGGLAFYCSIISRLPARSARASWWDAWRKSLSPFSPAAWGRSVAALARSGSRNSLASRTIS